MVIAFGLGLVGSVSMRVLQLVLARSPRLCSFICEVWLTLELCVPHLSWMGSSGTPPEAQAHQYPRRLAVRSLDIKAPSCPLVSHLHVIDTGNHFLHSLHWSSCPYDTMVVLTLLSSVPHRSLLD